MQKKLNYLSSAPDYGLEPLLPQASLSLVAELWKPIVTLLPALHPLRCAVRWARVKEFQTLAPTGSLITLRHNVAVPAPGGSWPAVPRTIVGLFSQLVSPSCAFFHLSLVPRDVGFWLPCFFPDLIGFVSVLPHPGGPGHSSLLAHFFTPHSPSQLYFCCVPSTLGSQVV